MSLSKKRKSPACSSDGHLAVNNLQSPERPDVSGLLQKGIDDIRALVFCGICVRPLYEPFTLGCGHTFCYSCLTQWFVSHERKKTCPDCRAAVRSEPAPAYMRAETERIESDKNGENSKSRGLFQGCFRNAILGGLPIRDIADGVERCPVCTWELEDGDCIHCGYVSMGDNFTEDGDYYSDDDSDMLEVLEGAAWAARFDPENMLSVDHFNSMDSYGPYTSSDEDNDGEAGSDDMDSFIDDDVEEDHGEDSEAATSTVVGNGSYLTENSNQSVRTDQSVPSEIGDSMSEGVSEHPFADLDLFRQPEVIELDDDNDDDDDEPIRPATMATRRRRLRSSSSTGISLDSVSTSRVSPTPSANDSSSEGPHGPVRRRQRTQNFPGHFLSDTESDNSGSDTESC
ncbi:predicted protein [Uncinocarpus reesii 1704]|uniref:RING-type domain-containing protein n=1 Tax=Uncinocarpus reesii (strain UAMH 1704) TaxID=336963 RepID=C4JUH6_UNCRE|nr:uncharacterized protein UREG_04779 [Uncinocarpus reesii 1704]EEP79937.1 predicted protein [Uncinocarpus reesii 1704]